MKRRKTPIYIKLLLVMVLLLGGGYAIFSDTLFLFGTATTIGEFDIQFQSAVPTTSEGCTPSTSISADGKNLTININNLEYVGAGATIAVVVKNNGNITTTLNRVSIVGSESEHISFTLPSAIEGTVIEPEGTHDFTIVIEWVSSASNQSVAFSVELDYEQSM